MEVLTLLIYSESNRPFILKNKQHHIWHNFKSKLRILRKALNFVFNKILNQY